MKIIHSVYIQKLSELATVPGTEGRIYPLASHSLPYYISDKVSRLRLISSPLFLECLDVKVQAMN